MKSIQYTRADGGMSFDHVPDRTRDGISEEDAVARARARVPADAIDVRVVDTASIPEDRTFRDAWKQSGKGKIDHDMPKARDIQRQRLREMRAPLLAELDVAYQRADERSDGAEKARITAHKQVLRDITQHPDIDRAKTIEDLKKVGLSS